MSDLNQTIESLKLEVAALTASNDANQSKINSCKAAITALANQVTTLQAELGSLRAK